MDVSFELDEERGVHSILPVLTSICKLGSSAPSLEVSVPKQPCQGKAAPSMGRQGWMDGWGHLRVAVTHTPPTSCSLYEP